MSTFEHQERIETPVATTTAVASTSRLSPGRVLGGLAGAVFTVVGIVAVTRTGIDSTLNEPVTDIMGITHSAYVGLFEIVIGLLLIVSSASIAYRGVMGTLGALTLVAGVVIAAATPRILLEVGATHSTGWFAIVVGATAIVASLIPSVVRSTRSVDEHLTPTTR